MAIWDRPGAGNRPPGGHFGTPPGVDFPSPREPIFDADRATFFKMCLDTRPGGMREAIDITITIITITIIKTTIL